MTTTDHDRERASNLGDQAQRIAAAGRDIRKQIEALFNHVANDLRAGGRRLSDIAREVYEGAAKGVRESAPPEDQDSRLRQVIDGLGDGLSKAANAARLAIEEAQSRGEHFARHDLKDMLADLRSLGDLFVDVVSRTTDKAASTAKKEAGDLTDHAKRTMDSIRPSLDQAADAVREDPARLSKETLDALGNASRQAAGALFGAMGDLLKQAADKLAPKPEDKTSHTAHSPEEKNSRGGENSGGCE